jgi:phosphopantetheinyl transferase
VGFWKITETAEELLQKYNPDAKENELISGMNPLRQSHYLACRVLAKSFYPELSISKDEKGKPHFNNSTVHFSWSHSGNYAAAIFNTEESTGIDIETVQPRILKIEDKFCNATDKQHIHRTRHVESLLLIWGAKESMFKHYGKKEVDFKKHMSISAFDIAEEGRFTAKFHKDDEKAEFLCEYSIFDGHIAVWILETLN